MIKTQLTREDALALLEVGRVFHKESQYGDRPYDAEGIWTILNLTCQPNSNFIIAYDSEYRGLMMAQASKQWFTGIPLVFDLGLFVQPNARGGKIAQELIKTIEEWAKQKGATEFTISHTSGVNTDKAPAFFNTLGFKQSGLIFTKEL